MEKGNLHSPCIFPRVNNNVLDTEDTSDDASVSEGDPVLGAPGETPANPTGPR